MKLDRAKIHNFRSAIDIEVAFNGYSLLIGPNNAGKSTVIDAIRAFYEKDGFKYKKETDFPLVDTSDQESWVELTFSLNDIEKESLADEYKSPDNRLRVRKYFQTTKKTHDDKSAMNFIFGYKKNGCLSDEPFYGAKNVQAGKFGDLVYVPAISKVDEHAKLSGPSALRDLLIDILTDIVEEGTAYKKFSANFQEFSENIRNEKTSDERSLSSFEDELNTLLKPWDSQFKFKVLSPSASDYTKSFLGWDLMDKFHTKPQNVENYGSGFQRHFIYSLIHVGSRYVGQKPSKKEKDFTPALKLLLFEEPEAFLHPPQQDTLCRSLMAMATSGHWQIICATHSSNFVSKNADDIPALIRLRRNSGVCSAFQINAAAWSTIVDANQAITAIAEKYPNMAKRLHEDDSKPEMEAVKHFLWLNADRCGAFFANHVLLVEGPTEVAFVNRLIGDGKIKNAECGLHILDCLGKYNAHRFMNLLSHLGIPHAVIHDDDKGEKEHAEINRLIEDTKHPIFTQCIRRIAGKLETMLGIPPAGEERRKPQHLLYQYESGKIEESKLNAFCTMVEECLPGNTVSDFSPATV